MLLLNTTSCNGTDLFWPFLFWLLGAFLLGLLIPWLLRLISGGGAEGDWKVKYESLDAKYNKLHNSNVKLQKDYKATKDGGKSYGSGSSKDKTDWKSKYESMNSKFSDLDTKYLGLQKERDELKGSAATDDIDWKSRYDSMDSKYNELTTSKDTLQTDYDALVAKSADVDDTDWKAKYEELEKEQSYGTGPNTDTGKRDDLTKVEGVGPKIQELLNNGGIYTFVHLSAANVNYLRKILDEAGPAYKVHQPGTWPEQSKMADEGKWDELKKWQDELLGGK